MRNVFDKMEERERLKVLVTKGPEAFRRSLTQSGQAPEQRSLEDTIETLLSTELGQRMLVHWFCIDHIKMAASFVREMNAADIPSHQMLASVRDAGKVLAFAFGKFEPMFLGENWDWGIFPRTDEVEEIIDKWSHAERHYKLRLVEQIAFADGFIPGGSPAVGFLYSQWCEGLEALICSHMDEIAQGLIKEGS